ATVSSSPTTPDFTGVSAGDIVTIGPGTGLPAAYEGTFRVSSAGTTAFLVQRLTGSLSGATSAYSINAASNIQFYPINTSVSKASDIAAWVNANASSVVTAV